MRIDLHYGPQQATETERSSAQANQAANASTSQVQLGQDEAAFSGAHVQVQALAAQALQLPEVREEKVQALRQALHAGQYQPNPKKTADAMAALMASGPTA
jgi:flagellar biosynthesis anti-sigma factor FlgM